MLLGLRQGGQSGQTRAAFDAAVAALRSGNVLGSRQMLQHYLADHPDDADALETLAQIVASQGFVEETTMLLRRAIAADPIRARCRKQLVFHLMTYSPALALIEIEQLPQSVRDEFEMRGIEGALAGKLGLHEREIRLLEARVRERPAKASPWVSFGKALKAAGRTNEAIKAIQRAIKKEPTFGEAWWALANFKSFKFSARDIAQMQAALHRRISEHDALHIRFALGKALEDCGDYEQSFAHYAAGNAIRARSFPSDRVAVTKLVDEWMAVLTPEFFGRNADAGCPQEGPIFIVGLHRSGSTLIEQILASHPQVEGAGELVELQFIRDRIARLAGKTAAAAIAEIKAADFRAIGEEYLERTRPFRHADRPYFVDKMPGNWTSLPLIRAALPNARIIDARRHPLACGFSNFKQNYDSGVGFSYDLKTIGTFYHDYARFMRRFDEVQPDAVHRSVNERLIEDPEGEVRSLLAYLGLPFEPSCLAFHRNDRAVRTPSAEQVRRPLNREGIDRWKNYEPWLGALKEALGPTLKSWDG
jgi:tetratricopeptide (TPR) repeat protein